MSEETKEPQQSAAPQQPEQPKFKIDVKRNLLEIIVCDPEGNPYVVDYVPVENILRVSYNCIVNKLALIIPEVVGTINNIYVQKQQVPGTKSNQQARMQTKGVSDKSKAEGESLEKVISGTIKSFKVEVEGTEIIKKVLMAYFKIVDEGAFNEFFPGFKIHQDIGKKVMQAMQSKQEESKVSASGLVDTTGNPLKSI